MGGKSIGDGDWGGGLLLPASADLRNGLQFQLTPSFEASVDADRRGRHFAFGSVAGVGVALSDNVGITVETSLLRDYDPSGHTTELLAGASMAWQPSINIQLDIGASIGLNHISPDTQLAIGISKRF